MLVFCVYCLNELIAAELSAAEKSCVAEKNAARSDMVMTTFASGG